MNNRLAQYLKTINKYPILTAEQEKELAEKIQNGDKEALQKLIKCNFRFVVSIARKYKKENDDLLDLINDGNLGLIYAAKKFNKNKKVKFISYAVWWIKNSIYHSITSKKNLVKVPHSQTNFQLNYDKNLNKLNQNLKREPTENEIAKSLDFCKKKYNNFKKYDFKTVSIDTICNDNTSFSDSLEDKKNLSDNEYNKDININNVVESLLNTLKKREKLIIKYRFGIGNQIPLTLEEIGKMFGVSRERIRQIEARALKKMSTLIKVNDIKELLT